MTTIAKWTGTSSRARRSKGKRGSVRDASLIRLFARFALTGLLATVVIGAVGFVFVRRAATSSAVRQATGLTTLAGRGVVEPLLSDRVLSGDPAALRTLDRAVRGRILGVTPIVRVKIWDSAGRIVYSDARQLIGARFSFGKDERRVLERGGIEAHASDLRRPENRTERTFRRLVEVYVGIRAPGGQRLLYEDYERSSTISASSRKQLETLLPALGGALLVLYLIQVPLAYSLARRLRQRQLEREQLLRRAIEASDLERRRIASDLHDSAVQRLAGVSLSLAATVNSASAGERADVLRDAIALAAAETRETIRELRTLLVDIYPPTLQRAGLAAALGDLVAPLPAAGIDVALDVSDDALLPEDTEALFYRIAQEAVRNARNHGEASRVKIELVPGVDEICLAVSDDGRGFSEAEASERQQHNHLGLRLMQDLVDHAGGRLEIRSSPGEGTSIVVTMPSR